MRSDLKNHKQMNAIVALQNVTHLTTSSSKSSFDRVVELAGVRVSKSRFNGSCAVHEFVKDAGQQDCILDMVRSDHVRIYSAI